LLPLLKWKSIPGKIGDAFHIHIHELFPEIKGLDDGPVPCDVIFLEIIQQAFSFTYQIDQGTLGVLVLLLQFQVLSQVVDAVTEQGNLPFRRTCIFFGFTVFFENPFFYFTG
jgi:hypothetical protein